jgi:short-subunit dehydrogenase
VGVGDAILTIPGRPPAPAVPRVWYTRLTHRPSRCFPTPMPYDFHGKVAVVTGASSGIGHATACALAARGATVIGVARREERLRAVAEACRRTTPASGFLAGDLGDRGFAERVVEDTLVRHGRLDILVNNAALAKHKHVCHLDPADIESTMQVNFFAPVWAIRAAVPAMLAQGGGTIVNVSSFAAQVVPPREAIYAASKAALDAFTDGLRIDLTGGGIHVVLVHPGPIDTEIWDDPDEPNSYHGRKFPPGIVADAILDAIVRRRHELTVPRRSPPLVLARALRLLAPSLLRLGMARMDPVDPAVLARASRAR